MATEAQYNYRVVRQFAIDHRKIEVSERPVCIVR